MIPDREERHDGAADPYFEVAEWEADAFHAVEVQACGQTKTVQLAFVDNSGDCHGPNMPGPVALSLDKAEELARWILAEVETIRSASIRPVT